GRRGGFQHHREQEHPATHQGAEAQHPPDDPLTGIGCGDRNVRLDSDLRGGPHQDLGRLYCIGHSDSPPFQSICPATARSTTASTRLSTGIGARTISFAPATAPTRTPTTSGAASSNRRCPTSA